MEIEETQSSSYYSNTAEWQAAIERWYGMCIHTLCQTARFDTDPAWTSEATASSLTPREGL